MSNRFLSYAYAATALIGAIWPFYFITKYIQLINAGDVESSIIGIATTFFDGAWVTPTSGFVSADTAILLVSIFIFMITEGKRLKIKLWGIYLPLTFLISLAFSFGLFMFMREKKLNETSE